MTRTVKFSAIKANQSERYGVYTFVATAQEIFKIAKIDRFGRDEVGEMVGFQRPQVARHIHEIRDYFSSEDAVLPNSVVIAFIGNVNAKVKGRGPIIELSVSIPNNPPGYVVDGQQRLSALQGIENCNMEIFVSAIVCKDMEDLRRQFILINNTKPLPNELIYELLPTVSDLPPRMSNRSFAAKLASKLNYQTRPDGFRSALEGQIKLHSNPSGNISCNAIHKAIMNSRSNGALREFSNSEDFETKSFNLIENFYGAVMELFEEAWIGYGPRESRLKHSVGIISLSYAMEMAYFKHGATTREEFKECLKCLQGEGICAWTQGNWIFNREEVRPWNKLQNTSPDIRLLSDYLSRIVKDGGIKSGSEVDLARKQFKNQISQEN